ncbi:MAG: ATPase, T2SS/T4P/T4SS family [Coprobacillaceae bacterium]
MQDEFEKLILNALYEKVTDIHITLKSSCIVYFRYVGQLKQYTEFEHTKGLKLINYIRFLSKIDMNYHWKPQTGNYIWVEGERNYYLRVSSLPSNTTDSLVIRILNNHELLDINTISYFEDTRKFLTSISQKRHGLFIVSGATGSGKSTTLYTLLDTIHKHSNRNIITLEDPIEVVKKYCLQIQMNDGMGITYQDTLKQVLRHDPDVIMIGEIRDKETAKLAINCALTGHLVLTTLHVGTCITTIQRLLHLDISLLDIKETIVGVLTQTMLQNKTTNKPVILSEFMNKKNIYEYLENNISNYTTYQLHAKVLLEDDIVSKKDIKEFLDE